MASVFFIFGSAEKNSLYKHVIYIRTAYAKIVKFHALFYPETKNFKVVVTRKKEMIL